MAFDPRYVAFEGRLHADRCTAEYVGRASHDADAACFRSQRAVLTRTRVYYFETQIVATSLAPTGTSVPPRINTASSSESNHGQDEVTGPHDRQRQLELEAMDMEDVERPRLDEPSRGIPTFNFSLPSRTMNQMQSRRARRRGRGIHATARFHHKIAVGFLLDAPEPKRTRGTMNGTCCTGISGFHEARRTVKRLMQQVLPSATPDPSLVPPDPAEREPSRETSFPGLLRRDLGTIGNSVAYVGQTGAVLSHGREFLRCERYGTGDVVGCGLVVDTKTFFFTLNGKLMGRLAACTVYDLDEFEVDASESDEEEREEEDTSGTESEGTLARDREWDGPTTEDSKVLIPAVTLHGVGESVHGVFHIEDFVFDLAQFDQQLREERQRALVAERVTRSEDGRIDLEMKTDDATMRAVVLDFFLHFGYERAYKAFEATVVPFEGLQVSKDVDDRGDGEVLTTEKERNMHEMEESESQIASSTQHMRESLSLRNEVRDHIRCCRTAQALVVLEHTGAALNQGTGSHARRVQTLVLHCRILCIIDVLTQESVVLRQTNGASVPGSEGAKQKGWNPELAIHFARQVFDSTSISMSGKRKRHARKSTRVTHEGTKEMALIMSLLLYDQREKVPTTSRARQFLTLEFRESVAERLNSLLLGNTHAAGDTPRVSHLETFLNDLTSLQKECLHHGCRVYPESAESPQSQRTSSRRRPSVSSSSDDSSASISEQEDLFDDDRET